MNNHCSVCKTKFKICRGRIQRLKRPDKEGYICERCKYSYKTYGKYGASRTKYSDNIAKSSYDKLRMKLKKEHEKMLLSLSPIDLLKKVGYYNEK